MIVDAPVSAPALYDDVGPLQPGVALVEPSLVGVEHRHDRLAEDVGDALVDAVVEGYDVCVCGVSGGWVFHRLCTCQVLHVQEVRAYLPGDIAVA